MYSFGKNSLYHLSLCKRDLQTLFNEVILHIDCSVISGYRSPHVQFELFKRGRSLVDDKWVITDKSRIVTYKDGYKNLSKHNAAPSVAVDVVPYPIDWKDTARFVQFGEFVLETAERLYNEGKMKYTVSWGGNFKSLKDYPHFQLNIK